jgi:aminoglycoside/choline kinase family phosphotransferase
MEKQTIIDTLKALFRDHFKSVASNVEALPRSGSDRAYFRLSNTEHKAIGAFNPIEKENEAFFSFTKTFVQQRCNVPELIAISTDRLHYLVSDLGHETLFEQIAKAPNNPDSLCGIKKSLNQLVIMQLDGGKSLDFSKCHPRERFDRQSIMWDLNYYKYCFLKLVQVNFDEQALEDDFNRLADFLLQAPSDYFMHRDFQTRNIMMVDGEPWLIDYQGGRKGPLQYDVASLLYSPKTGLNEPQCDALLDFYLKLLEEKITIDRQLFIHLYYGFVLIRILQALGAYGFRGIYEQKPNFKSSIPQAIENLQYLFEKEFVPVELAEIKRITIELANSVWATKLALPDDKLTVRISSFSYKNRVPTDPSENGGGFVFDCRGLPNPGRHAQYKAFSGLDQAVVDYLENYAEVEAFQENVRQITRISIEEYIKRGFNHLCVNFGCTGGQHRSVYHAQKYSAWVENNYPVNVVLVHNEKENWKRHE